MARSDEATESDKQLIDRIRSTGDEAAFRTLYRRHTPQLFQLLIRMTGGRSDDAEDVLQESWIRAATRLDRVKSRDVYPWLRSIALNVLREGARRHQRRLRLLEAGDAQTASAASPGTRLPIELDSVIEALPDGCRQVLVLHDIEGFTHEEIAERLGIAAGTSKSQLSAARRNLRRKLSSENATGDRDVVG